MNKRLLILACSQKKRSDPELLRALERYDGPAFKVLRKFLRQYPDEANLLDIHVLSAEFGLISSDKPIPNYDRKMQPERSQQLQTQVTASLSTLSDSYQAVFVGASRSYSSAIGDLRSLFPPQCSLQISKGGLGRRLTELQNWLYQNSELLEKPSSRCRSRFPQIKGVEITLTREQVLERAKRAVQTEDAIASRCQSWFLDIDNHQISPKWLVSQITELPVRCFGTHDACRVLNQLGIEVKRQ
ncbi:hypothetical protein LEP3755_02640 [Leptolyngbya sp. NIES-3755]|nr:hypothetical protein LEP3755_02640 [Leptolyngbya sp. NIES-3755]